jgi:hypothetical protein
MIMAIRRTSALRKRRTSRSPAQKRVLLRRLEQEAVKNQLGKAHDLHGAMDKAFKGGISEAEFHRVMDKAGKVTGKAREAKYRRGLRKSKKSWTSRSPEHRSGGFEASEHFAKLLKKQFHHVAFSRQTGEGGVDIGWAHVSFSGASNDAAVFVKIQPKSVKVHEPMVGDMVRDLNKIGKLLYSY